ncbi:MAG: Crp/Fnr family transcriptional regulator [Prevotella sp.]|jgi:CRP-like cAMP-binding protein|nr:Crp/Fnr family transcriptional regulator [Prevotella sp.]
MPDFHLYDNLLQFPLFLGMSEEDLEQVLAQTRLDFHKVKEGDIIAKNDDICQHLFLLVSGKIEIETNAADHSYSFSEYRSAPEIFQMEALFGLSQHYSHTYKAFNDCSFIAIDKEEIRRLYNTFSLFRLNYINITMTRLQRSEANAWRVAPTDLKQLIIKFFRIHSLYPAGEKLIRIKMTKLAQELNDRQWNISKVLNQMQEDGLLELSRSSIHIPALEKLLM